VDLEQRVKALEYEVKILKNEIQRALLDIQEQILVHYYPALRTEENGPSEGTLQSLESIRERRASLGPASTSPAGREEMASRLPSQTPEVGSAPAESSVKAVEQTSARRMSDWVSQNAVAIGRQRAARLVEACARGGWIPQESERLLLRLVSLSGAGPEPETVSINDVLSALLGLNDLLALGRDVEEALTLIEEANLG